MRLVYESMLLWSLVNSVTCPEHEDHEGLSCDSMAAKSRCHTMSLRLESHSNDLNTFMAPQWGHRRLLSSDLAGQDVINQFILMR